MQLARRVSLIAMPCALAFRLSAQAAPLPLKHAPQPTTAAITAADLMTRLYVLADDSMMGREIGTEYHLKATSYLEGELRRLGLTPAGDNGTYFQRLPVFARSLDTASTLSIPGTTFKAGVDFVAIAPANTTALVGKARELDNTPVVYGGAIFDTTNLLTQDQVAGKMLILGPGPPPSAATAQAFQQSNGYRAWLRMVNGSLSTATVGGDELPPAAINATLKPFGPVYRTEETGRVNYLLTTRTADSLLGRSIATAPKGEVGRRATSVIKFVDAELPGRNVVAIFPGSDPVLRQEYVAIGARSDEGGPFFRGDHDSIRVLNMLLRPRGILTPPPNITDAGYAMIRSMLDSIRKLRPGLRPDSIYNGANGGGSGAVAALELAEALAKGTLKPKRSILFVWHGGEEKGSWGSRYFTDHTTVPRDSIVALLDAEMIGRGAASDVTGISATGAFLHGGPNYLQLTGSRRLSTELGDLIEAANREKKTDFVFDYSMDADGHPERQYCYGGHYTYARYGIPIAYFTTGSNSDFHSVTDEPQYIDYSRLTRVTELLLASALKIADLDHRLVVDKPKPDPRADCKQ